MTKSEPYFLPKDKFKTVSNYSNVVDKFDGQIRKTVAAPSEIITDVVVRQPFTRSDYEYFRPNEHIPNRFRDIVRMCRSVYKHVGIVRNCIDLMVDLICDDIKILHPDKKHQVFLNIWAQQTNIKGISEEFAKRILIESNVVVRRITGKLTYPIEKEWTDYSKTTAGPDLKLYKENRKYLAREIPWRYTILNILGLDFEGGELAKLSGVKSLVFRLPMSVLNALKDRKSEISKKIYTNLPEDVRKQLDSSQQGNMPVDMDKVYISHYKKDSWEDWATPSLLSVLPDIFYKEKLRQAEISALDGVINVIRLWKLGDHKEGILPNDAAVDKLINILSSNTGGGAIDIVWDSMIEMQDFYPPVEQILGSEKYAQVNRDILIGLGVPEVLLGGKGANFSNSFIQLKTLVEKLKSVRSLLIDWINTELKIVCDGMDITPYPTIKIPHLLEDEGLTKKLIVGLLDRGVVSVETVLEIYGEDFLIEMERMKLEKEVGLETKGPFDNDQSNGENGRPVKTGDTNKRDFRNAKPRTTSILAIGKVNELNDYIVSQFLESNNIKNARQLTDQQKDDIDKTRRFILACINISDNIKELDILSVLSRDPNIEVLKAIDVEIKSFAADQGCSPNLNQTKAIEAAVWADFCQK